MERDVPRNELTAQTQRAYSNSRGDDMLDRPGAGENSPVNSSGEEIQRQNLADQVFQV